MPVTRSSAGSGSPFLSRSNGAPLSNRFGSPLLGLGGRSTRSSTTSSTRVNFSPGDGRAATTESLSNQTQSARKSRSTKMNQDLLDAFREPKDKGKGLQSAPPAVSDPFKATEIPPPSAKVGSAGSKPPATTKLHLESVHQAQQDTAKQLQMVLQALSALTKQVNQSQAETTPPKSKSPPKGSLEAFRAGTPGYIKSTNSATSSTRSSGDMFDVGAHTSASSIQPPVEPFRGFNQDACIACMLQTFERNDLNIFPTTTSPGEVFTTSAPTETASGHFANEQALFDMGDLGLQALYSDPTARDLGVPLHWMKYFMALNNEFRDRKAVLSSGKLSQHEATRKALEDVSAIHMAHFRRLAEFCWYPHPSPLDPQVVARAAPPRTRRSTAGSATSSKSSSSAKQVTNKTVVNGVTTWKCEHHKDLEKIAASHTTATCSKGAGGGD